MTYLRDLPVQELKIDRSLVRDVATDERSRMIVASTIQLAHALDMRTVAEGVEEAVDSAELVAMGVDILQGYHFARPLPASDVEQWVRDWTTTANLIGGVSRASEPVQEAHRRARNTNRVSRILDSPRAQAKRNHEH